MKSLCLAALLLVVFPAADLFEEANVDSSLVTAIPVPAPFIDCRQFSLRERFPQVAESSAKLKNQNREKWAGIRDL
jgi:hypothetical protein